MLPRRLAVIVSVLATLLFGAGGCLLGPLLPMIAREFHVPLAVCSLLFAVMFTGSILAVMIGGFLADRFGKKLLFLITLAGLTGAYALLMYAHSFLIVAVACLLAGAMAGTIEGLSSAVIADIDPLHVERNLNLLQVAFCAGAVMALVVASRMQVHSENWRTPYGVIVGAACIVVLLGLFMHVPPAQPGEPISVPIAKKIIRDRFIVLLAVAIALYVGSEMSLAWWISPILEIQYHYPAWASVLAAGLFWLTMGVGRLISGLLCHRYAGHTVLKGLMIGGLLAYILLLLPLGPWRLWAGVALAGFTFSGVWPLIVGLGGTRYPSYTGTAISVLVASGTFGGMLFPTVIGFVTKYVPMSWGLYCMAGLFILLTMVIWTNAPARYPLVIDGADEPSHTVDAG